jgi:hypothetical protein
LTVRLKKVHGFYTVFSLFLSFRAENGGLICVFPTVFFPPRQDTFNYNVTAVDIRYNDAVLRYNNAVYGYKNTVKRLQNTVFCVDSGTSQCTLFAYVLGAVGKKPWEKRRINRSFQCQKERKKEKTV